MATDTSAGRPTKAGLPAEPAVPDGRTLADLDVFWASYEPSARRYAWRQLDVHRIPPANVDVDDVTSQAYLDLREMWPFVDYPKAYTRSRVCAAVFAALRRETRRGTALDADPVNDLDDAAGNSARFDVAVPGLTVEEALVERETEARLSEALPEAMTELTEQQRQAVELCDAQDRPRKDVAAAMDGISVGAVNSHRARGLAKLNERLRPILFGMIAVGAQILFWLGARALPEPVRKVIAAVFTVIFGAYALLLLLAGVLWVVSCVYEWWSDSRW